jgi:hypothetical protein
MISVFFTTSDSDSFFGLYEENNSTTHVGKGHETLLQDLCCQEGKLFIYTEITGKLRHAV